MNPSTLDGLEASNIADALVAEPFGEHAPGIVLRDFLAANYARLHRRLLRNLGCADLASDCLHDAWLRLADTSTPVSVQNPNAYVYRVACNVAMDELRGRRSAQYDDAAAIEHLTDPAPGPDLIALARSDLAEVERAMQRMPYRHRSVLVALRIEEKTRQEVADEYQVSLTNIDTMLRQALDHCARETGQNVLGGINQSRRGFSRRWQAKVLAAESTALARQRPAADLFRFVQQTQSLGEIPRMTRIDHRHRSSSSQ
ncbi:sigma-70 family RNA polymerase sigma factor [Janthinobacterium sp. SUN100]|uniref:RNA polymerase sigma factor n=1 Tax=Janthinobacterium sp. SUN100 TaxID=3004101 RepID=UPI0025AF4305|nr:sigma-70 family RNA polymerase sigma factor [Janthinobacterium sp. SUN100]MDN2701187.1 sigma-70 family RNA polymerase sigma factor [Janthinobacterium sp. SUN100]